MIREYRHIGKATPRKDARAIVTGKAEYIGDIKLPEMLFGKVLRSPYPHANISKIDARKARACPGVKAVLTYKNIPKWQFGSPPHRFILDSKVRFVGDAVALVAAETEEIAQHALQLIDVEYEPLPAVYDVEEAMQPQAPQLYTQFPGNVLPRSFSGFGPKTLHEVVMGDVEKGFREADFIAEGTCSYENITNPLPPEPPGVIADWESLSKLNIVVASQSAPQNRMNTQQRLIKSVDVRSIGVQCGGSYGTKTSLLVQIGYAAALSRATKRPVKIYYTKGEHFTASPLRIGSRLHAKVGIKKDGTVTALSGEWLVNPGAAAETAQGQVAVGCGEAQLMLRCPNWNLQPKVVLTNLTPSRSVRGFGGQELKSALIPILSMALEKANFDPLEFFKKNFVKAGDGYYWRDGIWWTGRGVDFSRAMEKGAEVFGWKDKWKGWGKPTAVRGSKKRGVGVGIHGNADVGESPSEAWVKLNPDSTAVLYVNVSEAGMGQRSSLCKMVAEVLGLPIDCVNITPPDTLVNPFELGLAGSRGTYAVGSAVIRAAEDAKRKLFDLAASILGENAEDLETKDGLIYSGSDRKKRSHGCPPLASWGLLSARDAMNLTFPCVTL